MLRLLRATFEAEATGATSILDRSAIYEIRKMATGDNIALPLFAALHRFLPNALLPESPAEHSPEASISCGQNSRFGARPLAELSSRHGSFIVPNMTN